MNESIPQSIDVWLEQLHDDDPRLRYEAVHHFALSVFLDRFKEVYAAVWALTEDSHPYVRHAAGIAGSMISARHMPLKYPDNLGFSILGGNIPDFISEWRGE